jgi:hypothetical protein
MTDLRPIFYLDHDNCVLCEHCAEENKDHWIEGFRPDHGPYPNASNTTCDCCQEIIPVAPEYDNGESDEFVDYEFLIYEDEERIPRWYDDSNREDDDDDSDSEIDPLIEEAEFKEKKRGKL